MEIEEEETTSEEERRGGRRRRNIPCSCGRQRHRCRKCGPEFFLDNGKGKLITELKKLYKITREQYEELKRIQEGKCPICKKDLVDGKISIDHCHSTGIVRGLLHSNCNSFTVWGYEHLREKKTPTETPLWQNNAFMEAYIKGDPLNMKV